jgi:signal transduction histidine kinase
VSNAGPGEQLLDVVDRLQTEVEDLRRSRARLASAGYADRRAIERSLHDGVQQQLVALAVGLQQLRGLIDAELAVAKVQLDDLADVVRQALDETTDLAQRIHPPLLEARGLVGALRSAADRAGVSATIEGEPRKLPPELTAALYWCWVAALGVPRAAEAMVNLSDANTGASFEVALAGEFSDDLLEGLRDRFEVHGGRVHVDATEDGRPRIIGILPFPRPG